MTSSDVTKLLLYLLDGNYLDGRTKVLTAQLVTFNSALRAFVIWALKIERQPSGRFQGRVSIQAAHEGNYGSLQGLGRLAVDGVVCGVALLHACILASQLTPSLRHFLGVRFPSSGPVCALAAVWASPGLGLCVGSAVWGPPTSRSEAGVRTD